MSKPAVKDLRDRLPAVIVTVLYHIAVVAALLNAIPKYAARIGRESETVIPLTLQEKAPPRAKQQAAHRAAPGATALYRYYYPFVPPPTAEQPNLDGLRLALTSCAPEKLGNASDEIRAACRRIGLVVAANPEAFGVNPGFKDRKRWERELLIKQTPLLLPCASPEESTFSSPCLASPA